MVPRLRVMVAVASVVATSACSSSPRDGTDDVAARCARDHQVPVARTEVTGAEELVARYDGERPPALRHPLSELRRWDPYVVCVHRDGRVRLLDAAGEADLPTAPPPRR